MISMRKWTLLGLLVLSGMCQPVLADRAGLGYQQLTSPQPIVAGPVANALFLPGADAASPRHGFSGTIIIPEHPMHTEPARILPAEIEGRQTQLFPGVALEFVSVDGYLVPARRDVQWVPDSDSFWQIQVEPGLVWTEEEDNGKSRAAFPFVLTSVIENETYNGVATFLYDETSVSGLRYQVVQQLAPFMIKTRFVAAGQPAIHYRPHPVDGSIARDFQQELADRLVWRPWSELERRYGGDTLEEFDSGIDPVLVVTSGLVIDNEVYVRSMSTPWGDYPFPREMRHGVWSVTKTAAGLLTLLRMAQKYGDEILDYRIADYVDVTATHDGWQDVRFRHAMSMATGIGTGPITEPNRIGDGDASNDTNDADFQAYMDWYLAPSATEKLAEVFKVPSYPWGPGKVARYRDRDIFTLAAALDGLYRQREGDDADIWDMMLEEVYRPIGIHHLPMNRTRETGRKGVPLLAWGIYVTVDDIAKIAMLLQNGGAHDGIQLLSRAGVAEALYETSVRGLPTGDANEYGPQTYHLSLWHDAYQSVSGRAYSVPHMTGYGGNIVQLMPNGIVGFRFGNGGDRPLERMTVVADIIRPFDRHGRR